MHEWLIAPQRPDAANVYVIALANSSPLVLVRGAAAVPPSHTVVTCPTILTRVCYVPLLSCFPHLQHELECKVHQLAFEIGTKKVSGTFELGRAAVVALMGR